MSVRCENGEHFPIMLILGLGVRYLVPLIYAKSSSNLACFYSTDKTGIKEGARGNGGMAQGSHFSGDMKFHVFYRLFQCKSNEIPGQFGFESQCLC